jgi:hypothetical protein
VSAAPGAEFPNPCLVCGSTDEHAEFRARANGGGCTFCPHPAQPGHGTGCCCAGRSKPLRAYSLTELGLSPSPPPPLTKDEIRQLLRECVTVVAPGETLVIRGRDWTPNQVREIQHSVDFMSEEGMIPFKVLIVFGDELGAVRP